MKYPQKITEKWLAAFNEKYVGKGLKAEVKVKDWLVQPEAQDGEELPVAGSGYFHLEDEMSQNPGPDGSPSIGWWQTISGWLDIPAAETNVPYYEDTGFAPVLAMSGASLLHPDGGKKRLLAEGRLVLVRLDRIKEIKLRPDDNDTNITTKAA